MNLGIPTSVEQMPLIDLVIAGSVAVSKDGGGWARGEDILIWNLPLHVITERLPIKL
jgi:hypothetical protein